jgi:transcriptional regulator with XRE-family HTH domain
MSGRSASAVAKEAGVSKASMHKWSMAKSEPSRENLVTLARVLGVSVGWLAVGQDEAPRAARSALDKNQLAITIKLILDALAEEGGVMDIDTAAESIVHYYSEWERTGRQPSKRWLLSIVPKRR